MSRPAVLVFLLVILLITSQLEWKQQFADDNESISQKKQNILDREDFIKEEIILSQEKNIQRLNQLLQSLQIQLMQCRGGPEGNITTNDSGSSLMEDFNETEGQQPTLEKQN